MSHYDSRRAFTQARWQSFVLRIRLRFIKSKGTIQNLSASTSSQRSDPSPDSKTQALSPILQLPRRKLRSREGTDLPKLAMAGLTPCYLLPSRGPHFKQHPKVEKAKVSCDLQLIKSRWTPAQHQCHPFHLPHSPCVFFSFFSFLLSQDQPVTDLELTSQSLPSDVRSTRSRAHRDTLAYSPQRLS